MNIIRRNNMPVSGYRGSGNDQFDQFGRLFENMLEDFLTPLGSYAGARDENAITSPRVNLSETDTAYEIEAEMPGVSKEDVKVSVDNRRVTIEGESKRESAQQEGENVVYAERSFRRYARSFTLPAEVEDSRAEAKLENGILRLTLPKKESAQTRKLTIQ
jgi:HSP20 family protein